jgi:hypothetical protein
MKNDLLSLRHNEIKFLLAEIEFILVFWIMKFIEKNILMKTIPGFLAFTRFKDYRGTKQML